jgi:ADP-ribose pyrophosphatase
MIIKGKKYNFVMKNVRLPNGRTTRVEMVDHPGAVLIVPFRSADEIILLRQYRVVFREYLYELPAGTLEKKESIVACARRELREETGLSAQKIRRLGKIYLVPGYSNEVIYIFVAENLVANPAPPDADEIIEAKTVRRRQVQDLFRRRKIIDAKTICALTFCGWL